jgi:hypothetical protein
MRDSLLQAPRARWIYPIIVGTSVLAWASAQAVVAQAPNVPSAHTYSLASLQGDYAVLNHYGANLALGIGTEQFDGNGKCKGSLLLNRPTSTGARELVALTSTGTYTVNQDGTGTISLEVTLPDGSIKTATEDFVITRSELIRGVLVGTAISDEQREPSLVLGNGVFVTQNFTRRWEEPGD